MDALTRCTTLAALLWPDAVDVTLRIDPSARLAHRVSAFIVPAGESLNLHRAAAGACADAPAALDALSDFLAHLARRRAAEFLCAAGDTVVAPSPVPSRDELAARLAECERELADVTREHSALVDRYGAAVLRLAERDREPPQRAPGVVAGVAADVVDGWRVALLRATRGVGDVLDVCIAMGDAVAEARQRAGGGEGRGERVEGAQQGAADVGGVAERVVVAEGVVDALESQGIDPMAAWLSLGRELIGRAVRDVERAEANVAHADAEIADARALLAATEAAAATARDRLREAVNRRAEIERRTGGAS